LVIKRCKLKLLDIIRKIMVKLPKAYVKSTSRTALFDVATMRHGEKMDWLVKQYDDVYSKMNFAGHGLTDVLADTLKSINNLDNIKQRFRVRFLLTFFNNDKRLNVLTY